MLIAFGKSEPFERRDLRDDVANLFLRRVYKEVITGHHAEPERGSRLLSPRRDYLLTCFRIVHSAEGSNGAVERGFLRVSVGLADFKVRSQ